MTLFQNEMLENWRNKKWIWLPLVIILIAIMDPMTHYYLPQMIEMTGGLPEGATLEIPKLSPIEAVMMSLGQLSSLGVLIVVLGSMGTIANERKSGLLELILVKPVKYSNYITAKWTAYLLLIWCALFLGLLTSWYYINILFGDLSFGSLLTIVFFYGLWFTFVVTLSIFYNTLFKTAGLVAFLTIFTIMLMSVVTNIFGDRIPWSPNHLSTYIQEMLLSGHVTTDLVGTSIVSVSIIGLLIVGANYIFKTKELAN